MIRRHMILSAAVASLALSSCGGSDSSDSATPTPTPTPTPTASPTYSAFPLVAATQFSTIDATTSYTGDATTANIVLGAAGTESYSSRVNLATDGYYTAGTFVIDEIGNTATEESRFAATNLSVTPATTVNEFAFRTDDTTTAGKFSLLEFMNNTLTSTASGAASVRTTDASYALDQVSYANWWRGDSTAGAKRLTYTVWGFPTVISDMPITVSTTTSYSVHVIGRAVTAAGVVRLGGTATTTVVFSTGAVSTTLNLTTIDASNNETPYTTLTAQSVTPTGQNQFTGSFVGGSVTGTLNGGFFGSAGANIGIVFAGTGTINGADTRIVGEVVGKKQ